VSTREDADGGGIAINSKPILDFPGGSKFTTASALRLEPQDGGCQVVRWFVEETLNPKPSEACLENRNVCSVQDVSSTMPALQKDMALAEHAHELQPLEADEACSHRHTPHEQIAPLMRMDISCTSARHGGHHHGCHHRWANAAISQHKSSLASPQMRVDISCAAAGP